MHKLLFQARHQIMTCVLRHARGPDFIWQWWIMIEDFQIWEWPRDSSRKVVSKWRPVHKGSEYTGRRDKSNAIRENGLESSRGRIIICSIKCSRKKPVRQELKNIHWVGHLEGHWWLAKASSRGMVRPNCRLQKMKWWLWEYYRLFLPELWRTTEERSDTSLMKTQRQRFFLFPFLSFFLSYKKCSCL